MDKELDSLFEDAVNPEVNPEVKEETPAEPQVEEKPEQTQQERARQAEGRRQREREARAYRAARDGVSDTLKRLGIINPETNKPIESVDELEAYEKALSDKRLEEGNGTADDFRRIVHEEMRASQQANPADDPQVQAQLAQIRAMDPEMKDLGAILDSEYGEKFTEYVNKGLDFVDSYTLAAKDRLQAINSNRDKAKASKDHLSATTQRGTGALDVPPAEMALFRELNPGASEEDIRKYYNADRKRFG